MPAIENWDPRDSVKEWINQRKRQSHDMNIDNEGSKAKEQKYFKGVFARAEKAEKDENDASSDVAKRRKF